MNKFIALVGMTGSGKTTMADYLIKKGYSFFRFGQITLDIIKERGLEVNEENEKAIREEVRKKHGMAAYAILNIPKIEALLKKGNVVGDGLYSWSEYKALKEKYGKQLKVIAVYTPPNLRYERLIKRKLEKKDKDLRNRPLTIEEAKSRDFSEIENIEKAGPIAMADYTVMSLGSIPNLLKDFEEILEEIENE